MTRQFLGVILACALWTLAGANGAERAAVPDEATRAGVVREMLAQSRLLEDAKFTIPLAYWEEYLREQAESHGGALPAPVALVAEAGVYHLSAAAGKPPVLKATVRLHVFRARACANTAVLWAKAPGGWETVAVNGKVTTLPEVDGWLRFSPAQPGDYVVTAAASLKDCREVALAIPRTVRTMVEFESQGALELAVGGDPRRIRGTAGAGTRGALALSPREKLEFTVNPRGPETEHAPTFEVRGNVAWNFDAAGQTVSAALELAIVGGKTEVVDLALPAGATRVAVTGPDVREARPGEGEGGAVRVFLRGPVTERTRLEAAFQLPAVGGGVQTVGGIAVRRGHWSGGTVVVTSTGGGSEAMQDSAAGLTEIALADVPASAAARLAGPAALAYQVTGREWSAGVELLNLGEFALRESIADAAHYEVVLRGDGSMMCKARYEIRNRNKQFLRVELPAGATAVLARVNEQSRPLATVAGERDAYLLPLVRSKASLKGLVSFPVEIVAVYRVKPLGAEGEAALPLPRIDLPIAYAKCEAYVPTEMSRLKWAGVLQQVARYGDESGGETFGYGHGEAAEKPAGGLGSLLEPLALTNRAPRPGVGTRRSGGADDIKNFTGALASNYYRAGNEFYEKGDFENARKSLEQVVKLAPGSVEAGNSKRLLSNTEGLGLTSPQEAATPYPTTATTKEWAALTQKRQKEITGQGGGEFSAGDTGESTATVTSPEGPKGGTAYAGKARGASKSLSRQEKVAAAEVRGELNEGNRKLLEQQQQFLEKGQALAQEGKKAEAVDQYRAATALGTELAGRGADAREQESRLRAAKDEVAKADMSREIATADKKQLMKESIASRTTRQPVRGRESGFAMKQTDNPVPEVTNHGLKKVEVIGAGGGGTIMGGLPATGTGRGGGAGYATGGAAVSGEGGGGGGSLFSEASPAEGNRIQYQVQAAPTAKPAAPPPPAEEPRPQQVQLGVNIALQRAAQAQGEKYNDLLVAGDQLDVDGRAARVATHSFKGAALQQATNGGRLGGTQFNSGRAEPPNAPPVREYFVQDLVTPSADFGGSRVDGRDEKLQDFVLQNYGWQSQGRGQGHGLPGGPLLGDIAQKLSANLGQKVAVNSVNLKVDPESAGALGIAFQAGANGVSYALIDEAQFRTLEELAPAADGQKSQEAIVGTDALLANGWRGNVAYAADRFNKVDVKGNEVDLPHEKYLLINNGGYLTAVRTGPMQFWTEKAAPIQFTAAPQEINVPRVGQVVKFEKTLVKPTDDLGLRTHYVWKGAVQ